jgi:chloramphenicol 3-O phosphotransferase
VLIVLNGTSSSGKSTLADALRVHAPVPLQVSGVDTFLALQPSEMFAAPDDTAASDGFTWVPVQVEGVSAFDVRPGPAGEALLRAAHRFCAACASYGVAQVIDHVLLSRSMADDLQEQLRSYEPLYVAVHCPLDVLDQRERDRGDRIVGQGRGISLRVHDYLDYDLEIDTSRTAADDAARTILAAVSERGQ